MARKKIKSYALAYEGRYEDLSFAATEAYKLLRTNLTFSFPDENKCHIIGITSALHAEGKSTTAKNLACSFAETGKKIILVECDMRLPNAEKVMNIPKSEGLSNLLAGMCSITEVINKTQFHDNLYVIHAGDVPPNPSELLASKQMEMVVNSLAEGFDYIILDLPPITFVPDALVVAKLLSGMIIVVRRDYCNHKVLADTVRQLEFVKVKILGFVLTRSDALTKKYKYKGYYEDYSRSAATR